MATRLRIGFATCPPQVPVLARLAPRFGAIADVVAHPCRGGEVADALPKLAERAPHIVVAEPAGVEPLAEKLQTAVIPFEFSPDSLVPRLDEALLQAETVAVVLLAGTAGPLVARFLRRIAGSVHLLLWESLAHLPDVIARCRRMGVQAVVGGQTAAALAEQEGMKGFCVYERPDETDGPIGQMVLRAAAQAGPRLVGRTEELVAFGLILEKIAQGAIGPHDAAFCVDDRGVVTAAYGGPAAAIPAGVSVAEAISESVAARAAGPDPDAVPVALDLYPLARAGAAGYVAVLRGSPRPAAVIGSGGQASGQAAVEESRLEPLLQRMESLVERSEALAQAGRGRLGPRRLLGSLRRRMFLIDWNRVRYFELRSGLVHASTITGESYATNYTLTDIMARVDPRDFFRTHRNVIVNLNYVAEVERYGQGQLRLVLEGPDAPAFVVSRPASAALRKILKY